MSKTTSGNEGQPPISTVHNAMLERGLVTAFMADSACFDEASAILVAEDFYVPQHQAIYRACEALRVEGVETDLMSVVTRLEKDGTLDSAGGVGGVSGVCNEIPDVANVSHYAREIKDLSNKRRLGMIAAQVASDALKKNTKSADIIESAVGSMMSLGAAADTDDSAGEFSDIVNEVMNTADERREAWRTRNDGMKTGIHSLDYYLKPMKPGQLITIGARTSVGKTALALQIAGHNAMQGLRVMYNTLEMDKEECVIRALAQVTGVDTDQFESGNIPQEAFKAIDSVRDQMGKTSFWVDGFRRLTISSLASRARRRKKLCGLDLLIVDYLQLMVTSGKSESRVQEVSQITRGLKMLAGDLGVPIICVSQLNRAAEYRGNDETEDPMPKLIHLRESGSIEQDSNTVLLIHRNMEFVGGGEAKAKILLAKQRSGICGVTVPVLWSPATQTFTAEKEGASQGKGG